MKLEEFKQQDAIQYWLDAVATRAQSTRDLYLRNFRLFCNWLDETPDRIVEKRKQHLQSKDQKVRHYYEVQLKKYVAHLREEGLSIPTQQNRYATVRSFFDSHYMPLELRRTDGPSGEGEGSRIPEKTELRRMTDAAPNLKWRTLISFAKDCGWRIGDIKKLCWGDLEKIAEGYYSFLKLTQKKKVKAVGFIGPETVELLSLYRKQREDGGEKIDDRSLLFPSRLGGQLRVPSISTMISKLADMAGAENVTAHSLRKYFRANLEGAGVPDTWIKTMMGKKIAGSTEPYTEKRPKELLEGGTDKKGYKHGYQALRLEEAIDEKERRIQSILDSARLILGTSDEKIKQVEELLRREKAKTGELPPPEKVAEWLKEAEKQTENSQKVVSEDELPNHLSHGWRVAAVLNNGKVVIEAA